MFLCNEHLQNGIHIYFYIRNGSIKANNIEVCILTIYTYISMIKNRRIYIVTALHFLTKINAP